MQLSKALRSTVFNKLADKIGFELGLFLLALFIVICSQIIVLIELTVILSAWQIGFVLHNHPFLIDLCF
jgi:hypothetical protein